MRTRGSSSRASPPRPTSRCLRSVDRQVQGCSRSADRDDLAGVLTAAGFGEVAIDPVAPSITLGGGGDLDETVVFLLGTGIARALFAGAAPEARRRAIDAVTDAVAEFYDPSRGVVLGSGAWLVSATREP